MSPPTFEGVTATTRRVMQANRGKDTKPELTVRRMVHAMGFRFRLHRRDLPGSPDLVFGPRKKVIFVHGCFWHAHDDCRRANQPKTRREFWSAKLTRNRERDRRNIEALAGLGWEALTVWECDLRDTSRLHDRLLRYLTDSPRPMPAGRDDSARPRFEIEAQGGVGDGEAGPTGRD